jgi:chromosome segregation protein
MYLKSLELVGFKSFANKTTLEFHSGVTAIVGPNGCGKSNILDGIRWVLGEQSARALRGGEMADVIFNGTDTKPAVSVAQVSVTFSECENDLGTDYNELCLTRRVYRDGHSDFLLNGTICRLKDIQLLLMDTGIGRSAYSIMEQGKIDLILSSRPEDRRAIFEEAAGITKYKAQKKEALRKLEYTEANLLRLTDIMKEVKRQIGSLQRQAGKARRYKALFESLRVLDLHLAAKQRAELLAILENADAQIRELTNRHDSLYERIDSQEFGLVDQRKELEAFDDRLAEARQQVQEAKGRIDSARTQIAFNEERIAETAAQTERHETEIVLARRKLEVEAGELTRTDDQLTQLFKNLAVNEAALAERQERVTRLRGAKSEAERQAREFQREIQQAEITSANLQADLARSRDEQRAAQERSGILTKEIAAINLRRAELIEHRRVFRESLEAALAEVQSCRDAANDRQHELLNRQRELQELETAIIGTERIETEKKSRLNVLSQLIDEGEGLGSGTQAILRGLDDPGFFRPAVLGSLVQFVEVPAALVLATEAALGANLQSVLVQDPLILETIGRRLTESNYGRGAVSLKAAEEDGAATQIETLPEGATAWLLDRLTVRREAIFLVNRLLARVVLAPDLSAALKIWQAASSLAVVTPQGEFISENGILFAGSQNDPGDSILRRRTEVRSLESEVQTLSAERDHLETSRKRMLSDVQVAQELLEENREVLDQAQAKSLARQEQLSQVERELRDDDGKHQALLWEQQTIEERLGENDQRAKVLDGRLNQLQSEVAATTEKLALSLEQAANAATEETSLMEALQDLKIHVATERNRRQSLELQRAPIAARMHEMQELIENRQGEIARYGERITRLREANRDLTQAVEGYEKQLIDAEAQTLTRQRERAERTAAIDAVEAALRRLRHELSDCVEAKGQQEVSRTQHQLQLGNLDEHVFRRYQVGPGGFEPDWFAFQSALRDQRKRLDPAVEQENPVPGAEPETEWDFARTAVAEMTERLDAMGPINLEAIQEFDELEERQAFLEQQNLDLNNAKTELLEVIQRINRTTKELFSDTFEQVRGNFQEMFVELFGGGKSNLLLVDDLDPLESGIEIIAKPPGKQLQSISLLSGGEKTMTAVALLFAIYMVKPSPFCVLDEMDAPLDESNINRFIRILDRFVGQSQFVVITHNKRTIAKADVLYGITMEEQGISKLVGVRLTRREEGHGEADLIGTRKTVPSIAESLGRNG